MLVVASGFQQQYFRVVPRSLRVQEGAEAVLECAVANLAGQVQWAKDGFALGEYMLDFFLVIVWLTFELLQICPSFECLFIYFLFPIFDRDVQILFRAFCDIYVL